MQVWKKGLWGVALAWGTHSTFLVNLKFNCRSSILSLTVTIIYFPHFFPSYTLWLLNFVPSLKRNRVPPGCYPTVAVASPLWPDIPGQILIWLICYNFISLTCKLNSSESTLKNTNTNVSISITYINIPSMWLRINCWIHHIYLSSLLFATLLGFF